MEGKSVMYYNISALFILTKENMLIKTFLWEFCRFGKPIVNLCIWSLDKAHHFVTLCCRQHNLKFIVTLLIFQHAIIFANFQRRMKSSFNGVHLNHVWTNKLTHKVTKFVGFMTSNQVFKHLEILVKFSPVWLRSTYAFNCAWWC